MGRGRGFAAACAVTVALLAGVVAASVGAAPRAATPPRFGVADDAGKYAEDRGVQVAAVLADLGMKVQRWTLQFDPASPTVIAEQAFVDRALSEATRDGREVILSLFQAGAKAPDPDAFCAWAKQVAERWPKLRRFVIGNEVNASRFWGPQKTVADPDLGPRMYTALLAKCYDALKAVSAEIQVIGYAFSPRAAGSTSTEPLAFLRKSGEIYRASGRTKPVMDAIAVHPYPNPNAKPPPAPDNAKYEHADRFGIPQLDRVKEALFIAFNGTPQATTATGLPIVIAEVGYQSDTSLNSFYQGEENSPTVSETQQGVYHARIAAIYACDPAVTDVLYFGLYDEKQRTSDSEVGGWQSGLLRPRTAVVVEKPAYRRVKEAIASGCTDTPVTWIPPPTDAQREAAEAAAKAAAAKAVADKQAAVAAAIAKNEAENKAAAEAARKKRAADDAAAKAAADAALERALLAFQASIAESHPAIAIDGDAGLASYTTATLLAAAAKLSEGLHSGAGVSTVTMPPAFWTLPIALKEAVTVRALAMLVPMSNCVDDYDTGLTAYKQALKGTNSCVMWNLVRQEDWAVLIELQEIAMVMLSGDKPAVRICVMQRAEYYLVGDEGWDWLADRKNLGGRDKRSAVRAFEPRLNNVGEPFSVLSEQCATRTLSSRASATPLTSVTIGNGRSKVAAGSRVGVKVAPTAAKAQPGILLSFIAIRSTADPSKAMLLTLRPTVITPSDIAKATKARKAKVRKVKVKKKKPKGQSANAAK